MRLKINPMFAKRRGMRRRWFRTADGIERGRVHIGKQNGLMAEWLGKGLQNLVQRFESASDLTKTPL